ncbi:MAG TPA: TonB-dependent receptor, partial [Gemmatimonadales bacterium]
FGKMSMMGGLRFDARHLRAEENATLGTSRQSRNYGAVSGNAGIVFRPLADVALAANIGRAWRAPNLFELFANGPHPGEARYEVGDPTLETETATSVEGSIRWQRPRIRGEISAYHNRIGRYIYLTPTSEMNGTLRVYRYLQADADLDGAEASVEIAAAAPLTLRGQVDGVRATNRETGEPLPLTPPVRTEIAAELHTSGERWADRARLEILVDSYAEQTRLDPLDFPTEGYTLVGLEAGVEGGFLPHDMRLDLLVRNVGNTHYRDFLSRYKEFALNPGRDVSIRASLAF